MKLSLPVILATVLATAQAYELNLKMVNGVEVRVTGDQSTPCQDLPAQVRDLLIKRITFDKGSFTNEFMVWSGINCAGTLVKRASTGVYDVDPSNVGSIKVM